MSTVAYAVWAVIESSDGETVMLFDDKQLAEQYVERAREPTQRFYAQRSMPAPRYALNYYGVEEMEVHDALPVE